MRARDSVYHLSCFTCTTCNKTLTTGDHFGMKDSLVYCRLHFETLVQGPDYHAQLNFAELAAKGGGLSLPYFNGTGTAQKGRPRKRKSPAMGIDISSYNTGEAALRNKVEPHTHTHTIKHLRCADVFPLNKQQGLSCRYRFFFSNIRYPFWIFFLLYYLHHLVRFFFNKTSYFPNILPEWLELIRSEHKQGELISDFQNITQNILLLLF